MCYVYLRRFCNFKQYCVVLNRVKESSRRGDVTAKASAELWKGADNKVRTV